MKNRAKSTNARGGRWRLPALAAVTGAVMLPLSGCDMSSVLEVQDPDVLRPEAVADPANLPAVRAGVIAGFAASFSGESGVEAQVLTSGLLADEFYVTDTFHTRRQVDRRRIELDNSALQALFRDMQRTRRAAEDAAAIYAGLDEPTAAQRAGHAEMLNLAGFTYILFGENYCTGVPFGTTQPDGSFVYGEPESTEQMFIRARERFQAALAVPGIPARQENLARVGLARTLLNLGDFQGAADAVRDVPTSFVYHVEHSDNLPRQWNGIWSLSLSRRGYSVADQHGNNGLPFRSAEDPRVPHQGRTQGIDRPLAQYALLKYPVRDASVVLASGLEARLIEAEANLRGGFGTDWLATLNQLRASPPAYYPASQFPGIGGLGATPLTRPATQAAQVDLLFRERAFWLFATSHRLGDLRRLARPVAQGGYGRGTEAVFPTGPYGRPLFAGGVRLEGTFGDQVSIPVPFDEQNNPTFDGTQCRPEIP